MQETGEIIAQHRAQHPKMTVQDAVKLLFQNEFGCEHMVTDAEKSCQWIREEQKTALPGEAFEPIGNGLVRLNLCCGLKPETVCAMFLHTARTHRGSMARLLEKLTLLETEFDREYLEDYRAQGCPSVHHSESYRLAYHPSYRVVRAEYARYLELFRRIDGGARRIAIEGRSAAGKSTLAALLSTVYDCSILHTDDFFLQAHQRTPARYAEEGGNVDYERLSEAVSKLGTAFTYRPFDCGTMTLGEPKAMEAKPLSIVEGAYSLHPSISGYDLKVFLDISPEKQKERLLQREGEAMTNRFLTEWIPLEQRYFETFSVKEGCDLTYQF